MDINGLVNHTTAQDIRTSSLSPPEHSGSESARSQIPIHAARPYTPSHHSPHRERDQIYSTYQYQSSIGRISPDLSKRYLDSASPSHPFPPAKRRIAQISGDYGKVLPTRRRALQACEACRSKKSKCDNERPSCGSCIQHGMECIYKNAPFVPVLDAASMVLMEKLEKLEATILDQAAVLGKIKDATSGLKVGVGSPSKVLSQPRFSPSPRRSSHVMFQVPKGEWASLSYFLSLPFVKSFVPKSQISRGLVCDNTDIRLETKLPNLEKRHIRRLFQRFLDEIYPLHPIIEITTLEHAMEELEESGLSWTGEITVIMHILAIGCVLGGENPLEYNCAAKRRMGLAVEHVNILAVQAHYFSGLYWHLLCQPIRAARSFHHASTNAYLIIKPDREYTETERCLFWQCLKMEARYAIEVSLPESGLASLNLITESFPMPENSDVNLARWHASQFDLWLSQHALHILSILYNVENPDLRETEELRQLEKEMEEWWTALKPLMNELGRDPIKAHLQADYEALSLLLHRPFLQSALTQLTVTSTGDIENRPTNIASRAQKAIHISMKLISSTRHRQIIDWFALKQVIIAVLLVLAASRMLREEVPSPEEVVETMNGATEILARAANWSESAKRALQLVSEIWVGFKFEEGKAT